MTNGERYPGTREGQPGRTSETTPLGTHAEFERPVTQADNGGASTPEISADIERTRRQMGQRIDQIQAKLDPDRLISEAQNAVQEVISDTASSITDYLRENRDTITSSITRAARRNPLPTALVGLGVGWLLLESLSGDNSSSRKRRDDRDRWSDDESSSNFDKDTTNRSSGNASTTYGTASRSADRPELGRSEGQASESGPSAIEKAKRAVSQVTETVKDQVGGVVSSVQDQVDEMGNRVSNRTDEMRYRAEDKFAAASDRTQEMGSRMRQMSRRRGRQIQHSLEDNPLTYGALALAAGALIAYVLPQTEMENRALGDMSDRVMDEAGEMMQEASQRAKRVVDEVRPELEESAKAIGQELTESAKQLGQRVKEEATPVVEKARDAARDEARQAANERGISKSTSGQTTNGQSMIGQSTTGQSTTGQSTTGQSTTGQSTTGQSTTGQSTTGQSTTGQSTTGQSTTGQSTTGQSTSGQSTTGQSMTGQSMTGSTQFTSTANRNILQGKWRELRGTVKQKWGKLTDDELTQIDGSYDKLLGVLQRQYGYSQAQAEREINDYLGQQK